MRKEPRGAGPPVTRRSDAGPAAAIRSRASMLALYTVPGCTTIVFRRGTCVAHDGGNEALAARLLTVSEPGPGAPGAAARSLLPQIL